MISDLLLGSRSLALLDRALSHAAVCYSSNREAEAAQTQCFSYNRVGNTLIRTTIIRDSLTEG